MPNAIAIYPAPTNVETRYVIKLQYSPFPLTFSRIYYIVGENANDRKEWMQAFSSFATKAAESQIQLKRTSRSSFVSFTLLPEPPPLPQPKPLITNEELQQVIEDLRRATFYKAAREDVSEHNVN